MKFVFIPDILLCDRLGSKYEVTNQPYHKAKAGDEAALIYVPRLSHDVKTWSSFPVTLPNYNPLPPLISIGHIPSPHSSPAPCTCFCQVARSTSPHLSAKNCFFALLSFFLSLGARRSDVLILFPLDCNPQNGEAGDDPILTGENSYSTSCVCTSVRQGTV